MPMALETIRNRIILIAALTKTKELKQQLVAPSKIHQLFDQPFILCVFGVDHLITFSISCIPISIVYVHESNFVGRVV